VNCGSGDCSATCLGSSTPELSCNDSCPCTEC
jgi:hypothetical protein